MFTQSCPLYLLWLPLPSSSRTKWPTRPSAVACAQPGTVPGGARAFSSGFFPPLPHPHSSPRTPSPHCLLLAMAAGRSAPHVGSALINVWQRETNPCPPHGWHITYQVFKNNCSRGRIAPSLSSAMSSVRRPLLGTSSRQPPRQASSLRPTLPEVAAAGSWAAWGGRREVCGSYPPPSAQWLEPLTIL